MKKYYFIDKSGDADFFGKRGKKLWETECWNPLLILGMIETTNRRKLQKRVTLFHKKIISDPYFQGIPSFEKDNHYFHAKNDHPEVRAAFFQFLRTIEDFKCYFVIVRKNPQQFISEFKKSSTGFYFNHVRQLIDLPEFNPMDTHLFYLSRRNQTTSERFNQVLETALCQGMNKESLHYKAEIVKNAEYPELWITDYMLWAVQRSIIKGEKRFLNALSSKVVMLQETGDYQYNAVLTKYTITEFLRREFII